MMILVKNVYLARIKYMKQDILSAKLTKDTHGLSALGMSSDKFPFLQLPRKGKSSLLSQFTLALSTSFVYDMPKNIEL